MHETYLLVQPGILSSTGPGHAAARPSSQQLTALMLIFMSSRYLHSTNWTDGADTGVILSNATLPGSRFCVYFCCSYAAGWN